MKCVVCNIRLFKGCKKYDRTLIGRYHSDVMNTHKLIGLCKNDPELKLLFAGVFPADQLPKSSIYPAAYIVNTDPRNKPGTHWIAIYIDYEMCGDYFDSYGRKPLPGFKTFLDKNCIEWEYNSKQIQAPLTSVCGQYCLYFLYHRARGVSMREIVQRFGQDKLENDKLVMEFVNSTFKTDTDMIDVKYIVNQVCKALSIK